MLSSLSWLFSPSLSFFWKWFADDIFCILLAWGSWRKGEGTRQLREKGKWGRSKMELLKNFGTVEILQPNGSLPEFSYEHLYSLIKGQAYCLWWYTWATFRSLNRVNTVIFSAGTFSWNSEDMSNDSSDVLLHPKPLLFGGRDSYISFSEDQNQVGLSSGSCWHLYGNPPGDSERGSLPPVPFQGSAGITEGLQPTVCLILSPKEGLSQMPFPSVQGPICQSPNLKVKKKKKQSFS